MSARINPPRTASPALRKFFEHLEDSDVSQAEISRKCKLHANTFYGWRSGKVAASIFNMEAALSVMGLRIEFVPDTQPEPEEIQS